MVKGDSIGHKVDRSPGGGGAIPASCPQTFFFFFHRYLRFLEYCSVHRLLFFFMSPRMLFIHSLLSVSTSLSFPPSPLSSLGPFPTISFPHALDPCFAILILLSRFILRLCSFTHFSPTSSVSIPRVFPLRLLPPSHSRGKTRAAAALRSERGSTTSSQEPGGRWCK